MYLHQYYFNSPAWIITYRMRKKFTGLSTNVNEIFWVTNNGADMPVRVMGNTASKVIILIVHGGPGDGYYIIILIIKHPG